MNEMVQKVAQAICGANGRNPSEPSSDDFKAARAAIAAMREPTKAMEAAWDRDFDDWMEERIDEPMHMWMTLIDEALK
jgi:hypothetical protein